MIILEKIDAFIGFETSNQSLDYLNRYINILIYVTKTSVEY